MNTQPALEEIVHGDISAIMQEVVTDKCKPDPYYMESMVPKKTGKSEGLNVTLPFWTTNALDIIVEEIHKAKNADPRAKHAYKEFKVLGGEATQTYGQELGKTRAAFADRILKEAAKSSVGIS